MLHLGTGSLTHLRSCQSELLHGPVLLDLGPYVSLDARTLVAVGVCPEKDAASGSTDAGVHTSDISYNFGLNAP
jgi:hypothetical protein